MANDFSLELRRQVVTWLKGYAPLTALVSADHIHGEQPKAEPVWPFIRVGLPESEPYEAQGLDGSSHRFTLHTFSKGPFTDSILLINKQVLNAMDALELDQYVVEREHRGTNTIRDTDEAGAYHSIIRFDITIAERV